VCPSSLDHEEHVVCRYGVFKVRAGARPAKREHRARRGLSKLSSTRYVEVDVVLGELETGRDHHGRAAPGVTRAPDSLERR